MRSWPLCLWLVLASCAGKRQEQDPCSGPGTPTWENFAEGHVRTWCLGCHSASLQGAERQGAPAAVDFDRWSQVHAWRQAILARAAGPGADMPPLGGVPGDAVARFEQWLSCGARGSDAAADPCESLSSVGDRVVASQADADALCAEGNATGDLTVQGTASIDCLCAISGSLRLNAGQLELPRLERVQGDLQLQGGASGLSAPALRGVGGTLSLSGPVQQLLVPGLVEVGGDLRVSDSGQLARLELDALYQVGGAFEIERARLVRLYVPRLKTVGGDLSLQDLPDLVALDGTRALKEIAGSLILRRLDRLPGLDDWAFLLLERVGQDVVVEDNAQLVAIHGLTLLSAVPGDLLLQDNPSLVRVEGFDQLLTVHGDLVMARNAVQELVPGMVNLERVEGTLQLLALPSLRSLVGLEALSVVGALQLQDTGLSRLSDFPALQRVEGSLAVVGNEALSSVQEWEALSVVGGAVEFRDNPLLPTSAIELWLMGLDSVGGTVTLSGNGPQ